MYDHIHYVCNMSLWAGSERQHIYDLSSDHTFGKPREFDKRPCGVSDFRPPGEDAKQWSGIR